MTTSKPYHGRDAAVSFRQPTVGARVYVFVSATGWSQTINRKEADAALVKFLHPLPVPDVLQQFVIMLDLKPEAPNWEDILKFLGEVTGQPAKQIPTLVAISFWGQITILAHPPKAS